MADAARDGALASPGQAQEPPDAAEASSSQAQPVVDAADVETVSEDSSQLRQQPNCEGTERPDQTPAGHAASSIAALAAASGPLALRRVASSGPAAPRGVTFGIGAGIGLRSRSRSGGDDGDRASSELVLQLQRLCRRQRQRSEERAFVRDVERVLALLRVQTPAPSGSAATSATYPGPGLSLTESNPGELLRSVQEEDGGADEEGGGLAGTTSLVHSDRFVGCDAPTLAEIDALLDCIADLFEHRNPSVRSLAFEVVQLCLLRFGERLTPALRRKVFLRLETHTPGDFLLRQKALRALTQDGRHLQPFHVELGWLLLNLLEESDAQRDLLGLIQCIFRRSPRALDRDKVIAIVSIISSRCEVAWSRGDLDACNRFVAFYHVLAANDLAFAASTPVCLRSLCCLVNADGHGTWSIMKLLLNGTSGFLVLRGLLQVLENPTGAGSPWVLRGAVFFVGMSCWGSQRVTMFDDIVWGPVLLALEKALDCCRGVVIFEVILSLQRLIKKFGATNLSHSSGQNESDAASVPTKLPSLSGAGNLSSTSSSDASSSTTPTTSSNSDRRLVMEWEMILRMLKSLRPWVSMTDEHEIEDGPHRTSYANIRVPVMSKPPRTAAIHPADDLLQPRQQQQMPVSIQQTRIPRELLDTLQAVEDLVEHRVFAGDIDEFLNVLEDYLPHLSESSMLFLLRQRAEAARPGYHLNWLATLSTTMRTFFLGYSIDGDTLPVSGAVRLEALEALRSNLWTSRNVCEDRVIEEVVLPTLSHVYEDPDADVRCRSLEFLIEVARQLESVKFDAVVDIIANAMALSSHEDAQVVAASGIVSLFSSAFDHLPPARAVRMYDLLATTVETHRSRAVRHVTLTCMLNVCEGRATDGKLQWRDQQVRTSRFLFVSRRAARANVSGVQVTAACVPVARALRSLLTLVSSEPDAELFRMAVKGIKIMLENRAILEDVDVSEVLIKVVASIDYRAFGRAAIADEVNRLLNDQTTRGSGEAAIVTWGQTAQTDGRTGRLIPPTGAELVRSFSAHALDTVNGSDDTEASFNASLRATAVLLAKTQFLTMGVELLQLLISYEAELHGSAVHELARCLVGTMELRLTVAEKDFFASGTEDSPPPSSSASHITPYHHEDSADPYTSGAPLNFTSRVLSRFQTSASHGSLFQAFSSSVNKSSLGPTSTSTRPTMTRTNRKGRVQLQEFLRRLFDSEFKLLHTTTTALSLLSILAPSSVLDQFDGILHCLRGCITTVEGDFRSDAFVAVLEMLSTIAPMLSGAQDKALTARKAIVEMLLLGFEYAKSRQLSYLAFRVLCQVIYQCDRHERIHLAALAMPTLEKCTCRGNSLLAEAAVDFLMCFAYSQSSLIPSALVNRQQADQGEDVYEGNCTPEDVRSRCWVYKRSLLTITTTSGGNATLVIRRANCTSRWELDAFYDQSLDVKSSYPLTSRQRLNVGAIDDDTKCCRTLQNRRPRDLFQMNNNVAPKPLTFSGELQPLNANTSSLLFSESSQLTRTASSAEDQTGSRPHEIGMGTRERYDESMIINEANGKSNTASSQPNTDRSPFQHLAGAAALPPLPAYDGVGGSPSYFCDNTQVRRQPQPSISRSVFRSSHTQSKGDRQQECSSDKTIASRAIRKSTEGHNDTDSPHIYTESRGLADESIMDAFTLDGSFSEASVTPTVTSRISRFDDHTTIEPTTVGNTHEPQGLLGKGTCDPLYLMMQLFDVTMENRPQLLSDGPPLKLALNVLDRTPEYETHKIGLLYVRDSTQSSETSILGNVGGSLRYLRFLRGLGTFTKLEGLRGYTGGLDSANNSDGKFGLVHKDEYAQVMFHVATMMIPESNRSSGDISIGTFASMKKKRHIGNDFVHVVFKECDEEYDLQTLSGQFNDVHIVIQPLNDNDYRTEVHVKPGIPAFGPLYGRQIVSSSIISKSVRLTCLNANLACQVFHQDLVGFALNCEERLKQIKQLGLRLATTDDWAFDK